MRRVHSASPAPEPSPDPPDPPDPPDLPPPRQPDVTDIPGLARLGMPDADIAAYLRLTIQEIRPYLDREVARARALRRHELRQAQWKAAMEGGVQLLALLGKHELGQGESQPQPPDVTIVRRMTVRPEPAAMDSRQDRQDTKATKDGTPPPHQL